MKYFWKTKSGEKIDIDEMSIEHLRNVLKLILRNSRKINKNCPTSIEQALDLENSACDATEIDLY